MLITSSFCSDVSWLNHTPYLRMLILFTCIGIDPIVISFNCYTFFIHIYYRVDSVVCLQKSRSDPDQVQHPGPGTTAEGPGPCPGKSPNPTQDPGLVASDSHSPDRTEPWNQGPNLKKSTGAGKK